MQPTTDQIKGWTEGKVKHPYFKDACKYAESMETHALGKYPKELIKERRPSESKHVHEYREKIFESPTVGTWGKVFNSLSKIRKASDYSIQFSSKDVPAVIAMEETPQNYLMREIPTFGSIDNWFWSICFQKMLVDSNAVVLLMPMSWQIVPNEYVKPYPIVFESDDVIDYNKDEWYFLESDEVTYFTEANRRKEGKIYYYVDKDSYYKYTQTDSRGGFSVDQYVHNLTYTPVVSLRGIVEDDNNLYTLNRSRLFPMIGWMNEAVREYSDLQAGVVQSMFPTYWAYQNEACSACNGIGQVQKKAGSPLVNCPKCEGKGTIPLNPYEHIKVKPESIGKTPAPIPPGGIIEKDTKVIEIQDARISKHQFNALKAVNMEHLDSSPLNQSGVAKEWDRSEANNFVYSVAEDCVRVLDEVVETIIDMRYSVVVPNKEDRYLLAPTITVPTKFDISTDATIANDLMRMKDAKFNQMVIAAAEADFVSRRFITDQSLRDTVMAMHEVDGLAGKAEEDIAMGVANGWITKEAAIIHANIKEFIDRALIEDVNFLGLPLLDKKAKMKQYAQEQINITAPSGRIAPQITPTPSTTPAN